jgi:hypothetical protein
VGPKEVPDTKMDRPTDRRSQHQLNSIHMNWRGLENQSTEVGNLLTMCAVSGYNRMHEGWSV